MFNLHSKLAEPIDDYIEFFKSIFPQAVKLRSFAPPLLVLVNITTSFSSTILSLLFVSSAHAHRFTFVVLLLVIGDSLLVLYVSLAIESYR